MTITTSVSSSGGAITVVAHGLDKYIAKTDPALFRKTFNKYMNVGLRKFAYSAMRIIMKQIHSGSYAGGGGSLGVQRYIKGSDSVLIETRDLMDHGIGWKFVKTFGTNMGLLIGARDGVHSPSGLTYKKFITLIQSGTRYNPSKAQRSALKIKAEAAGAPEPTGDMKQTWVIPPRPFLSKALLSPAIRSSFKRTVTTALNSTLRDITK